MWEQLQCVSVKDGSTTQFEYRSEEQIDAQGRRIWEYSVRHPDAATAGGHQYFAKFRQVDDVFVQVTMLDNASQLGCTVYRGKGITERLFQIVKEKTGLRLVSSSNKQPTFEDEGDFRSESATDVWKHFVDQGKATTLPETDRFEYTGHE